MPSFLADELAGWPWLPGRQFRDISRGHSEYDGPSRLNPLPTGNGDESPAKAKKAADFDNDRRSIVFRISCVLERLPNDSLAGLERFEPGGKERRTHGSMPFVSRLSNEPHSVALRCRGSAIARTLLV